MKGAARNGSTNPNQTHVEGIPGDGPAGKVAGVGSLWVGRRQGMGRNKCRDR